MPGASWSAAEPYEAFMGRWSRRLAAAALAWLDPPRGQSWLDVGCGIGAVSAAVLQTARPGSLIGVDPSQAYVLAARTRLPDPRARFEVGDAAALPVADQSVDHVISGLVLNFVPDVGVALREMRRVLTPGGRLSAWVWDYAHGMQMLRTFWDATAAEDPPSAELDEGAQFPICRPDGLRHAFVEGGLEVLDTSAVDIPMVFSDFDDYWQPFLGGQGPASAYCLSLSTDALERLRSRLAATLPTAADGSIHLSGRAWAATARSPA